MNYTDHGLVQFVFGAFGPEPWRGGNMGKMDGGVGGQTFAE